MGGILRNQKIRLSSLTGVLLLAAVVVGGAPLAHAETSSQEPETHCLMVLAGEETEQQEVCASTPEALYQVAYDELGIIYSDGSAESKEIAAEAGLSRSSAAAANRYPLGVIYDDRDFRGSSYAFTSPNILACNPQNPVVVGNLSSIGWNDRLSSVKGSACSMTLFADKDQGGRAFGPVWAEAYVGDAMNDKTTSILFWN